MVLYADSILQATKKQLDTLEIDYYQQQKQIIAKYLAISGDQLTRQAVDYSRWDELYHQMDRNNYQWFKSNISGWLPNYTKADLVILLNQQGKILDHFNNLDSSSLAKAKQISNCDIVETNLGPAILTAKPVLQTNGHGPAKGLLILGRLINNKLLTEAGSFSSNSLYRIVSRNSPALLANNQIKTLVIKNQQGKAVSAVVIQSPNKNLLKIIRNIFSNSLLILVVSLLASVLLAFFFSYYLCHKLQELKNKNLELLNLKNRAEQLSILDDLTGLYNYRYLRNYLSMEVKRSIRYSHPLTLLMLDIDFFKNYNDCNGHPAGNKLLIKFAKILQKCCRETDIIARYGGEEFTIVLVETDATQALLMAERIRSTIETSIFPLAHNQPQGRITVSIGLAVCPRDAENMEDLLSKDRKSVV